MMRASPLLILAAAVLVPASRSERKRGFVGFVGPDGSAKAGTCYDAEALNLADSWFYNWWADAYNSVSCDKHPLAAEYVPMINRPSELDRLLDPKDSTVEAWRSANVHFLLGVNEPDLGNGQHPGQWAAPEAAGNWSKMQQLAARFEPPLTLVSPSVSHSGPDAFAADGSSLWLDEFFAKCAELADCDPESIKYIGMHDHGNDAAALERKIAGAASRYQRDIWLTEFNILQWGKADTTASRSEQDRFLAEALPMLDKHPKVFRYAWVSARSAPNQMNGGSNLLPYDSLAMDLTSTGKIYAQVEATHVVI